MQSAAESNIDGPRSVQRVENIRIEGGGGCQDARAPAILIKPLCGVNGQLRNNEIDAGIHAEPNLLLHQCVFISEKDQKFPFSFRESAGCVQQTVHFIPSGRMKDDYERILIYFFQRFSKVKNVVGVAQINFKVRGFQKGLFPIDDVGKILISLKEPVGENGLTP